MEKPPRLENSDALTEKDREIKRLVTKAFGQASAFNLLDPASNDPRGEIQAAKDTGRMLQETLRELILLSKKE